jgi:hypothetical protein
MRPLVKSFGSLRRPEEKKEAEEEEEGLAEVRRWDSEMSRRSSRSWARRDGASSGRVVEEDCVLVAAEGLDVVAAWSGGREDCDWRKAHVSDVFASPKNKYASAFVPFS